jgi:hypothetical protein
VLKAVNGALHLLEYLINPRVSLGDHVYENFLQLSFGDPPTAVEQADVCGQLIHHREGMFVEGRDEKFDILKSDGIAVQILHYRQPLR